MKKIFQYFKDNAKQVDWKAVCTLTICIQVLLPLFFYFIDGNFAGLMFATGFCCIFIYPMVIGVFLFGKEKKKEPDKKSELTGKCPTCGRPWL